MGEIRRCTKCNRAFYVQNRAHDKQFCSKRCAGIVAKPITERECFNCKKVFPVSAPDKKRYCSEACAKQRSKWMLELQKCTPLAEYSVEDPLHARPVMACSSCGEAYNPQGRRNRYCEKCDENDAMTNRLRVAARKGAATRRQNSTLKG